MNSGLRRALLWAPRLLSGFGILLIVLMLVNIVADITLRSSINEPIQGTLELTTYWYMVGITFIGIWMAQVRQEHISVSMVTDRFDAPTQRAFDIFSGLLTLAFLTAISWFGLNSALHHMARGEFAGADRIPVWPIRFIVPAALVAYAITLVMHLVRPPAPPSSEPEDVATASDKEVVR